MRRTTLFVLLIALAAIGIADSWYLAQSAATQTPLICDLGAGLDGCNTVAQSPYSRVFGIPLADFGLLYFGALLLLSLVAWRLDTPWFRRILLSLTFVGAAASVYFVTLQAFVIKAYCVYCLISALLSFVALVLAAKVNGALTPRAPTVLS